MAFVWGDNGAQLTPEAIAAQRKVAQAMMARGGDYSPLQSAWQGAARMAEGLMGGFEAGNLDRAEKANTAYDREYLSSILPGATPKTAAPSTAPSVATPMGATSIPAGKEGFVSTIMPMAIEASKKTGIAPEIIVAQAALESGWGKSAPGNNLFGIKSHGQPGGNTLATTEVVNGQPVRTTDSFRAYASPADSVNGYADFMMQNPRYAALRSAQGIDAQLGALGKSGYATDPMYADKVGVIARSLSATSTAPAAPVAPAAAPASSPFANVNPRLIAGLSDPRLSDGTKKILGVMLEKQMAADKVQTVDLGNKIGIMDSRGNITREIAKGEPNKGPEFGVIGKDEFGNEQYGWRDPRNMSTTPIAKPASSQPTATSTIPPAPAGVDPKIWRETQSKAAAAQGLPGSFDDTSKLRHEFTQLPAYKNMAQAAPIYQSMRDAAGRDTKAADLNIVYGLGKIMDPGSVVREGELVLANNAQGWQEKLNGMIAQINSKGALTPEGRQALMAEAYSRMQSYKQQFDQDAGRYRGISANNRINAADVIPDFGTFEPWSAPKAAAAPVVIDGYSIKAR